jgi:hypothetical protein
LFLVYDKNMNPIKFPDGVKPLDIFISSISKERFSDKNEGANGVVNKGFTYGTRDIQLYLLLKSYDTRDYRLLRNAVYAMFQEEDEIYISEEYEKGKRYLVTVDERYIPERRTRRSAEAKINCSIAHLPFAESIGTTQDIQISGINSDDPLWGFGMGLIDDPNSLIYTHTTKQFSIYNAGNVPIHPFEQDLKITISQVVGSTEYLELKNLTNGTAFRVNEGVTNSKTIIIDGPEITSNGLQYTRMTNKGFIELEPGWNEFQLSGATSAKVEFDFPFYYK